MASSPSRPRHSRPRLLPLRRRLFQVLYPPLPATLRFKVRQRYLDLWEDGLNDEQCEALRTRLLEELLPEAGSLRRLASHRGFDRVYYGDVLVAPHPLKLAVARQLGLMPLQALEPGEHLSPEFERRLKLLSGRLRWTRLLVEEPTVLARFADSPSEELRVLVTYLIPALVRLRLQGLLRQAEEEALRQQLTLGPLLGDEHEGARLREAERDWAAYLRGER
jgi:hypothetical protein